MDVDDELFPAFRIAIQTASRIIACDLGAWEGVEFSNSEYEPFIKEWSLLHSGVLDFTANAGKPYFSLRDPHEFSHIFPVGRMKLACEALETAMIKAVDLGHLVPREWRRALSGDLQPDQTFLNIHDVTKWLVTVGLVADNCWSEYCEAEMEIASDTWEKLESLRFSKQNRAEIEKLEQSPHTLTEEEVNAILIENLRFKEKYQPLILAADRPLSGRERDTLLTIIGVLLGLVQSHKPGRDSEAAVIKEMLLNYDEKSGISKRTLEQKFAAAKRVLGHS